MFELYSCTPICKIAIALEGSIAPVGPAGDALYVPLRITGGNVLGENTGGRILCGMDIAVMYADEKLMHNGRFVVADPAGDVLVWYDGPSQGAEGAYDDLLDGRLPVNIPSRLHVRIISTAPGWRPFNRRPLLGVGSFNGLARTLDFTVLMVSALPTRN